MGLISLFKFKKKNKNLLSLNSDRIIESLPGHVYWLDRNGIILGCNKKQAEMLGKSAKDMIGKSVKTLFPGDDYSQPLKINEEIFNTGRDFEGEEDIILPNGEKLRYFSKKIPLKDEEGKIEAVLGISFDLTELLMSQSQTAALFDTIIHVLPINIYWRDKKGFYLGCNDQQAKFFGLESRFAIIGKTSLDLWEIIEPKNPNNKANSEAIDKVDQEIMKTGIPQKIEEKYISKSGEVFYFHSQKLPLRDEKGEIMGIVGVSIDITKQKEAEELRLENEINKKEKAQHEILAALFKQLDHDIQSPVSAIETMTKSFTNLTEDQRIDLRNIGNRIDYMIRNLSNQFNKKDSDSGFLEEQEPVLVSVVLLDRLGEKRYEFQNLTVEFEGMFKEYFVFIDIEPDAFSRMISNLINNAVHATQGKKGKVTLKLEATKADVKITVQDNGKGMSSEAVEKILNNISFTEGKENGHGIGYEQIRGTLQRNHGELKINSALGKGTKVILTFPRITAPSWIADEIRLGRQDIVVVLDDEPSVTAAWQSYFSSILQEQKLQIEYFNQGQEALDFLNSLSPLDKKRVLLITDYELLRQKLNGLDVAEQSGVERVILATSHYTNKDIRARAVKSGIKILPKRLISEVSIKTDESIKYDEGEKLKKVDLVLIDDDENFTRGVIAGYFIDWDVDCYVSPTNFLKNSSKYPKDTRICLDKNFAGDIDGIVLAKKLHDQGFTRIFLISGTNFKQSDLPEYISVLGKANIQDVRKF